MKKIKNNLIKITIYNNKCLIMYWVDSPLKLSFIFEAIDIQNYIMEGDVKMKRQFNVRLSEDVIETFKKLAKERDIKQNQLFKDMLQAYLILNAKDQKEEK